MAHTPITPLRYGDQPANYTVAEHKDLLEKSGLSAKERKRLDDMNYYLLGPKPKVRLEGC